MTTVYILLRAEYGKIGLVKAALSKHDEIKDINEVFGRYDIICRVVTKSTGEFKKFARNKLRVMEGIKSIEPLFVSDDEEPELT